MQTIWLSAIFWGPQNISELKHCQESGIVGKVGVGRTTWPLEDEDEDEDEELETGGTVYVGATYFGFSLGTGASLAALDIVTALDGSVGEDSFSCVDILESINLEVAWNTVVVLWSRLMFSFCDCLDCVGSRFRGEGKGQWDIMRMKKIFTRLPSALLACFLWYFGGLAG